MAATDDDNDEMAIYVMVGCLMASAFARYIYAPMKECVKVYAARHVNLFGRNSPRARDSRRGRVIALFMMIV